MNLTTAAEIASDRLVLPDEWSEYDPTEYAAVNMALQDRMVRLAQLNGMHSLAEALMTCRPRFRLDGTIAKGRTEPCGKACCAGCGGRDPKASAKFITDMVLRDQGAHRGYVFTLPPEPAPFDVRLRRLAECFTAFMATAEGKAMIPGCIIGLEGSWKYGAHPHGHVVGEHGEEGTFTLGRSAWRTITGGRVSVRRVRIAEKIGPYTLKRFKYRPHQLAGDDDLLAVLRLVDEGFKFSRTYGSWIGNTMMSS